MTRRFAVRSLASLVLLSLSTVATAQMAAVDELAEAAIRDWQVPGLALAVVRDGKVIHQKGYGFRDVAAKAPVTSKTVFAYGSITKSFTVLTLAELAATGKVDWDKPMRDQLPGFALTDPVANERATPRDLVSHRTGMPRHDLVWIGPEPPSRAELFARLRHLPPSADFRAVYQYNNLMFMAAGMLAGHAAGRDWESAVRDLVLVPSGLDGLFVSGRQAAKSPEASLGYDRDAEGYRAIPTAPGLDSIAPAGAIHGDIEQLTRYLRLHMDTGAVEGKQLLPAVHFQAMRRPQIFIPAGAGLPFVGDGSYGMGLFLGEYKGRKMIYHTGTIGGFHAMMWWLPDEKLGVAILINRVERSLPPALCLSIADRLLNLPPTDWTAYYRQNAPRPPVVNLNRVIDSHPSRPLHHFAGEFEHAGHGRVTVRLEAGGLIAVRNGSVNRLPHFHFDVFGEGPNRVGFLSDLDGRITELEWKLEPAVEPIRFKRVQPQRRP